MNNTDGKGRSDEKNRGVVILRRAKDEELSAADWLAKLDRGELSTEEHLAFKRWLGKHPENKQAIRDAAAMWYGLNAGFSKLAPSFRAKPGVSARTVGIRGRLGIPTVASTLGIVAALAMVSFISLQPGPVAGYYVTKIGETRSVSLSDGSTIDLNTNSIVEQDYSRAERVVRLITGEAIFDVAHGDQRPFIVYAADGVIRAVGTRFAVRIDSDRLGVTVVEGRVGLARRTEENRNVQMPEAAQIESTRQLMVGKGEAAEIDRGSPAAMEFVSERDIAERVSWSEGRLVFHDKELRSVLDEVARYTTVEIRVVDKALRTRKITGVLSIGQVDLMLEGIEGALGVRANWASPNLVYLTSS